MDERKEPEANKSPWLTFLVIVSMGIALVAYVAYDLIIFVVKGREWTISPVIQHWGWSAHPLVMIGLGMIIGGLLVHFFLWKP